MNEQPSLKDEGQVESINETVRTGLRGLTPADTGWILAVVIIILGIQVADYFAATRLSSYLELHQANQVTIVVKMMERHAETTRRYQELIKSLTDASIRDGERAGRAIEDSSRLATETGKANIFEEGQDGN